MAEPVPPAGDPDVVAAELALGLLEGEERAAALRRQLGDPAFARDVERWREQFANLFATSAERVAPDQLFARVEARLDAAPSQVTRVNPGFWRPLSLAAMAAAASLGGVLLLRPGIAPVVQSAPAPAAQMVAAFALTDKGTPLAAYYDSHAQIVRMPPMPVPAGRSAQLWAIVDGKPPVPLGLFRVVGSTIIADAKGARAMAPGTMLAISIEPVGGSRTGRPTGPVVASGMLNRV